MTKDKTQLRKVRLINHMTNQEIRKSVTEHQLRIHTPFSPTIIEYKVPQRFLDIINTSGDAVLPDDGLSKKFDFSDNLVGKVSKEVLIPIMENSDRN